MNGRNEENLKELFGRFVEAEQAEKAAEDIRKGEQILRGNPAPQPSDELIADIKAEIAAILLHKKENAFRRIAYKTMAVAAGFILIAVIGVKLFEKGERPASDSTAPKAIWESESLADETLTDEIEQIESDIFAVQLDEYGGNGYEAVTEIEMELIETNGDFWKG